VTGGNSGIDPAIARALGLAGAARFWWGAAPVSSQMLPPR
jgi:NAD(P)-dependent dehydrogenase (short-subunit alcohol dehydrogenase family)